MTAWQPGMKITAARLNDGVDATTVGTGMTGAALTTVTQNSTSYEVGTSVSTFLGTRTGKVVTLDFVLAITVQVPVTHAATTMPTSSGTNAFGNFPDFLIATSPTGWRPTTQTIIGAWDNGTCSGGFVIGTDGKCTLRTGNGAGLTSGTNLTCQAVFILT